MLRVAGRSFRIRAAFFFVVARPACRMSKRPAVCDVAVAAKRADVAAVVEAAPAEGPVVDLGETERVWAFVVKD